MKIITPHKFDWENKTGECSNCGTIITLDNTDRPIKKTYRFFTLFETYWVIPCPNCKTSIKIMLKLF